MITIPVEDFKISRTDDQDLVKICEWFIRFIPLDKWRQRKADIEKRIGIDFRNTPPFSEPISEGTALAIKDDLIGWYLYLLEVYINEPHKYEYYQGARIIPIFKRFGMDFQLLMQIEGINSKTRKLVNLRTSEADAILFEILSALAWARNGWQVSFIEDGKSGKTPDFVASKADKKWYVECKRQSKTSEYALKERAKWQKMISYLSQPLIEHNMLLDVVFHVELATLPDTYLKELLYSKLRLIVQPGKVVSNEQVDINVSFVNIRAIKNHMSDFDVKHNSPQLAHLIGRKPVDNLGFTSGMEASFFRVGSGTANNLYVNDIEKAFGAFWRCDAKEAITAKARDIKKQIFAALEQFHPEQNAVVHIGMETFDGPAVEQKRFLKITDTVNRMDVNGKKLNWGYFHFFQSYSTFDQDWVFDETVSTISSNPAEGLPPLDSNFLVIPEDEGVNNLSHWERPLP